MEKKTIFVGEAQYLFIFVTHLEFLVQIFKS